MTHGRLLFTPALAMGIAAAATAQNWTATDINGVQHNLQSYLNQGKTVLVDLSAHWCGPCWQWHTGGVMHELMHEFGPEGTNDLMIFFIDASTNPPSTMNLINGIGSTQGNWAAGTNYPIIGPNGQGNVVGSQYNFNAFPTLFVHCPGGGPAQTIQRSNLWQFFQNWRNMCPAPFQNGPNDATLLNDDKESCPGDPINTILYNAGTSPLTSATVQLKNGNTVVETINWTGSLAPHQFQNINFAATATTPMTYEAVVSSPNGQTDDNPQGNSENIQVAIAPQISGAVEVKVRTDNYGNEFYWRIVDGNGAVMGQGGNSYVANNHGTGQFPPPQTPPGTYGNNQTYTQVVNLPNVGCYTFEAYDFFGDGICCAYGQGFFEVKNLSNNQIVINGGNFGGSTKHKMLQTVTGVEENLLDEGLAIYPNPTDGLLFVNLDLRTAATVNLTLFDMLGAVVMQNAHGFGPGEQRATLDLNGLANGTYYLNILADGMTATRKVVVNR
ncbi:MAG: T9SS type A sorting domain-containing protein [Flavobacteriales bacterium]|nr:T9SS type A sorting domain-containing protein [Flavobacteriales bacterium]